MVTVGYILIPVIPPEIFILINCIFFDQIVVSAGIELIFIIVAWYRTVFWV